MRFPLSPGRTSTSTGFRRSSTRPAAIPATRAGDWTMAWAWRPSRCPWGCQFSRRIPTVSPQPPTLWSTSSSPLLAYVPSRGTADCRPHHVQTHLEPKCTFGTVFSIRFEQWVLENDTKGILRFIVFDPRLAKTKKVNKRNISWTSTTIVSKKRVFNCSGYTILQLSYSYNIFKEN